MMTRRLGKVESDFICKLAIDQTFSNIGTFNTGHGDNRGNGRG